MMTMLVMNGFGLLEVRKLYIDELMDFNKYMFLVLEQRGEAKKGTFEKLDSMGRKDNTVSQLRQQIFKINIKK